MAFKYSPMKPAGSSSVAPRKKALKKAGAVKKPKKFKDREYEKTAGFTYACPISGISKNVSNRIPYQSSMLG